MPEFAKGQKDPSLQNHSSRLFISVSTMYENGLRITMMSHYWLKPVWYILNWVAHVRKVVSGYLYYLSKAPRTTTPHQYVRTKVSGWGGAPPIARYPPGTQRGDLS